MKSKILKFQIISFIVVGILGTLLHFVYEWSGNNVIVGLFSAVNESTWEHLKLIFYPMVLMSIIGNFFIKDKPKNYWCAKTIGIIIAMIFTVVFFYTYTGVIGKNIDWLNIATFFIAVALGEYVAYKIMMTEKQKCNNNVAITIFVILGIMFIIFTYYAPKIGLFEEPKNNFSNIV